MSLIFITNLVNTVINFYVAIQQFQGIWLLSIAIRFQCCLAAPLDEPVTNYVVGEDDIGVNEVLVLPDFQGPIFREDLYLLKNRDEKQSSKDEILKRSKRSPEPKPLFGLFRRGYYGEVMAMVIDHLVEVTVMEVMDAVLDVEDMVDMDTEDMVMEGYYVLD